ncbi:MAG TPA: polysaccharide deacetylase family protein [Roseiarcus sp.]|nr:polysaccharide deacetylase family protein [Roseiarcus sp.]
MKLNRRSTSSSARAGRGDKLGAARKSSFQGESGEPRDFVGYGGRPPHPHWPGEARIAVNFNLNVEAGGENSILEGDKASEGVLTDIGYPSYEGARSPLVESSFEFGPRVGCWRLLRIFKRYNVKISVLGVVSGLQRYADLPRAFVADGHEIVSHGWRWIDYTLMGEKEEREHIRLATEGIEALTGKPPVGWFSGRPSANTRRLVVEQGGYLYDRDYLGDELPFWLKFGKRRHLVVPYSLETNDNRFDRNSGFSTADEFARYMIDCFDLMYEEGAEQPKLMSIALHDRLIGRPARAAGLIKFLDYATKRDRVWFCTGREIAEHWRGRHPPVD